MLLKILWLDLPISLAGALLPTRKSFIEAKESALAELQQRAAQKGANAIVGIDLDYETVGANGGMLMVTVSGTAVVI